MATFQTLYTGEGAAVRLPDLDRLIESQAKVGERVIKGEEAKLSKAMQDEAWVMEQMKANPVLLINDRQRTEQAAAIERYNNIGADLLTKNKGVLGTADKLILQREKDALVAAQQRMLADQQRFQQEYALIQKDQGAYYDKAEFDKAMGAFYETGVYPPTALMAKPQSFLNALSKSNARFSQPKEKRTQLVDGVEWQYDVVRNMTADEAKVYIADMALSNEAYVRDIVNQFEKLPETEQARYLDMDADGKVSPEERQQVRTAADINNPIIRWAQDFYMPYALKEQELTGSRTPVSIKGQPFKFNPNVPVSIDNNKNALYQETTQPVRQGDMTFDTWVDLKRSTTGFILVNEWEFPDGTRGNGTANVSLDMVGYSPSADKTVAIVKKASDDGDLSEGETIILNGERYDNVLRRELGLHRQGFKSFKGANATNTGQASFQGTYVEYKRKFPNGTPEEYQRLTGKK